MFTEVLKMPPMPPFENQKKKKLFRLVEGFCMVNKHQKVYKVVS